MSSEPFSVLLVDDDPDACAIFKLVMDHHHLPFTIIMSAEEALDYLKGHSPDVVLMDLFLPGMDGYRALDLIRQSGGSSNICVIATTAYYTHDTEQEAIQHGFNGYMPKPFLGDTLIPYLRTVVSRN